MKKNIIKVKMFQNPLICLIGILIFVLGMIVESFMKTNADEINYEYQSNSIGYDSTNNSLNADNVKDAIDELYEKVGQCPADQFCYSKNMAFIKAYTYDESACITGDETGCVEITCYENGTCPVGTIIDYLVNNTTIVRFHVLHDDGETMTMQTQRNTIYNVAWHVGGNDTTKGPDAIMVALKIATDGWVNVSPINITESTTGFAGGFSAINNLCTYDSDGNVTCSSKQYDIGLIAGTYRARMITMQEATDYNVGQCLAKISGSQTNAKSCRMFMNNYLYQSNSEAYCRNVELCVADDYTENGGEHNWGYWTMGAMDYNNALDIYRDGTVHISTTHNNSYGARAVVVVDK